jgi:hypothetical protein
LHSILDFYVQPLGSVRLLQRLKSDRHALAKQDVKKSDEDKKAPITAEKIANMEKKQSDYSGTYVSSANCNIFHKIRVFV